METTNLYLLSIYLKKWSFNDFRLSLNYSYCFDNFYDRNRLEMRLGSAVNMVNEFLNSVFNKAKEKLRDQIIASETGRGSSGNNLILINEPEIKRKLNIYFSKINKEFRQNKRHRGRSNMITTRSLDFYYNDFEFEPLAANIKFYVHFNRGVNKMNGDLWSNAIDDFRLAMEINPDDIDVNKMMARALYKLGRYHVAIDYLKKYSEHENTPDSLSALAKAYLQINEFDKAEDILKKLAKQFPDSNLAQFGMAQLKYKKGKAYKSTLDKIWKRDPLWLKDKLKTDWEYRTLSNTNGDAALWKAATAARYLGFDRPFDLTQKAFRDEIPSYFDSDKGTIRFNRAELDAWVEIMNRYEVDGVTYSTYQENLTAAEKGAEKTKPVRKSKTRNTTVTINQQDD